MRYILVLQWSAGSEADFDALIAMEDVLEVELPVAHGFVDGHDFGSGEMNIFVYTDQPQEAFVDVMASLRTHQRWPNVRAAYRPIDGDQYVTLWPATLREFSVS